LSTACEREEQDEDIRDMKDVRDGEGRKGREVRGLLQNKIHVKKDKNIEKGVKDEGCNEENGG
jgi:hypothetical protein